MFSSYLKLRYMIERTKIWQTANLKNAAVTKAICQRNVTAAVTVLMFVPKPPVVTRNI